MIKLEKHERVDWFRITVDLNNEGISLDALAKMSEIPRSTVQGWRYRNARPKLEEAIRVLNIWADITGSDIDHVPVYNPFLPDSHPSQP
jgi:exonuclease III